MIYEWINERCFRPQFCTQTMLGMGEPRLMRWILVSVMPQVKDPLVNWLSCSLTYNYCAMAAPLTSHLVTYPESLLERHTGSDGGRGLAVRMEKAKQLKHILGIIMARNKRNYFYSLLLSVIYQMFQSVIYTKYFRLPNINFRIPI